MTFDRVNVAVGAALAAVVLCAIAWTITTVMTSDHREDTQRTRARFAACSDFELTSDHLACLAIVAP